MNSSTKRVVIGVGSAAGLLIFRAVLPTILTRLANIGLQKIPGCRGRVQRVRLDFITPRLVVHGLTIATLDGEEPAHRLEVTSVIVGSRWRDILATRWIGYLRVERPRVSMDLTRSRQSSISDNGNNSKVPDDLGAGDRSSWQESLRQLPAFRISSAILSDGAVHLLGIPGQDARDIRIERLNLSFGNLTNSLKVAPTLAAEIACTAQVMLNGNLALRVEGYPLAQPPVFDLDFQTSNVDLTDFRSLIEHYTQIGVHRGTADLYLEAVAANGLIAGYAKPIFDHLELDSPLKGSNFISKVKVWGAKAVVKLGKNKRKDRISTRLEFDGSLNDPSLNITQAVVRLIRNSFGAAERAAFERRNWFGRAGSTPAEVKVHLGTQQGSAIVSVPGLLKETFSKWSSDSAPRMAAALSYYTAFSMAPLLILAIAIAGLLLGHDAAQGKIVEQIGGLVGKQSAIAIQSMIESANRPSKNIFASIISIISLIAGATGVLSELKSALNTIWRTQEESDFKEYIKKNILFVGMLLGIGFLLTVSLVASAAIAGLGKFLGGFLPAPELLLQVVNFALSISATTILFAAMYRFLPNTRIEWHDVWVGALVTSFLFELGKLGLGLYIGKSSVGSSYGAAGSVLIVLLWVYYSGLIFYFGAEFTKVYADHYGSRKAIRHKTTRRQP